MMNALRIVTIALIGTGLGLPSAHGLALCIDSDGDVAVEAAVNGACVGAQVTCCEDEVQVDAEPGLRACVSDHCGGCRDVVISADGDAPPPLTNVKGLRPHLSGQTVCAIAEQTPTAADPHGSLMRGTARLPTANRPPPGHTVVLRL